MTRFVNGGVEFLFYRPEVLSVAVAGSFNGWDAQAHPMRKRDGGWWATLLHLPPGDYQFRYFADGQWHTDFAAFGVMRSREQWNSVLFVPKLTSPASLRQAA